MTTAETRRTFVVDAGVGLKWVLPEPEAAAALRLLEARSTGSVSLHVPELWLVEVGNALWARTRRAMPHRLTRREAADALGGLTALRLRLHGHHSLAALALVFACDAGITMYDAVYLALAVRENAPLVTADSRLLADARRIGLGDHVVALADVGGALGLPSGTG